MYRSTSLILILALFVISIPLYHEHVYARPADTVSEDISLSFEINKVYYNGAIIISYQKLSGNYYTVYKPGFPAIPYVKALVVVPQGRSIVSFKVSYSGVKYVKINEPLYTVPYPRNPYTLHIATVNNTADKSTINHTYTVEKNYWRGVEYWVITIFPADYYISHIVFYTSISIHIEYSKNINIKSKYDPDILNHLARHAINKIETPIEPMNDDEKTHVLILTRPMFINALKDYVELRKYQGYDVKIVTVEEIISNGSGRDIPEKIRNYIKQYYYETDLALKYVLIIGDLSGDTGYPNGPYSIDELQPWEVPTRYFYNPDGTSDYSHTGDYTPSDWYYVTLDTTWDEDGDGIYGESGDGADWAPEIAVSRLPFRSVDELSKYLKSIITYRPSISKVLGAGAILWYFNENDQGDYGFQGDTGIEAIWTKLGGIGLFENSSLVCLYEHYPVMTKITSPSQINGNLSDTVFKEALYSDKYGVVVWFAHGWVDSAWRKIWSSDDGDNIPEDEEYTWKSFTDIWSLEDNRTSGLVLSDSCLTAYYDVNNNALSKLHLYSYDSLGEYYLKTTSLWYIGWDRVTWGYLYYWDWQIDPEQWGGLSGGYIYRILKYLVYKDSPVGSDIGWSLLYTKQWSSTIEDTSKQSFRKVWWASTMFGDLLQPINKSNIVLKVSKAIDTYINTSVSIHGVLMYGDGEPLANKTIYLVDLDSGTVSEIVSNDNGEILFNISLEAPGIYRFILKYPGSSDTMPYTVPVTIYVSPSPHKHWISLFNTSSNIRIDSITYSPGYIYVSGILDNNSFIAKVDYNGSITWFRVFDTGDLVCERSNIVYHDNMIYSVQVYVDINEEYIIGISALTLEGEIVWSKFVSSPYIGRIFSIDAIIHNSTLYIAGITSNNVLAGNLLFVITLSLNGDIKWAENITLSSEYATRSISGIDITVYNDTIYIATTILHNTASSGLAVLSLGLNGDILWGSEYVLGGKAYFTDIESSPEGLYVAGWLDTGADTAYIVGLLSFNGSIEWFREINWGGNGSCTSIVVPHNGRIYLVGYINNSYSSGYDYFILSIYGDRVEWGRLIGSIYSEYSGDAVLTNKLYIAITVNMSSPYANNSGLLLFTPSIGDRLLWINGSIPDLSISTYNMIPYNTIQIEENNIYVGAYHLELYSIDQAINGEPYSVEVNKAVDTNIPVPIPEDKYVLLLSITVALFLSILFNSLRRVKN